MVMTTVRILEPVILGTASPVKTVTAANPGFYYNINESIPV